MDHAKGVLTASFFGTQIYMSQETIEGIKATSHNITPFETLQQFQVGSFDILPFDVEHDVAAHGFLIFSRKTREKLCFIADTCYCKHTFKGVTHWMIEANHSREILDRNVTAGIIPESLRNRIVKSHMGIEVVKKFFRANDLSATKEIWLIHLSQMNSHPEQFKKEIKEVTGKVVYLA